MPKTSVGTDTRQRQDRAGDQAVDEQAGNCCSIAMEGAGEEYVLQTAGASFSRLHVRLPGEGACAA